MRLNNWETHPWYEDTDSVKQIVNEIYGAKVFGIKEDTKMNDYYKTPNRIPAPKKIIISEDARVTVVLWADGTKTVVKCSDTDTYDPYTAYCAAFAKKCYGTNSQLKKTIEKFTVYQDTKMKNRPCPDESLPPDPLQSRFRMMDFTYLKEEENG